MRNSQRDSLLEPTGIHSCIEICSSDATAAAPNEVQRSGLRLGGCVIRAERGCIASSSDFVVDPHGVQRLRAVLRQWTIFKDIDREHDLRARTLMDFSYALLQCHACRGAAKTRLCQNSGGIE